MGLIHINTEGFKDRCRAGKSACPYGGPHGQSITRQRLDKNGKVKPKPAVSTSLPVMTIGEGKHYKKIAELVAITGQRFTGGNPVEYLKRRREMAIDYAKKAEEDIIHPDWDSLSTKQKLNAAVEYCDNLIREEGLHVNGWHTKIDNNRKRYGACKYGPNIIVLSKINTVLGRQASIIDTIRHEVAHAVAGAHAGHGSKWQEEAVRLGATPKATKGDIVEYMEKTYKYVYECENCKRQKYSHTDVSKRYCCGKCDGNLIVSKNPLYPL